MYRLLIVDDEEIIVDGLLEIFDNSGMQDIDIYKAYSVFEALEIMNRIKINIVITDISMPGMSGIEFHDRIREKYPFCRVIYLTGYDRFEYAQSAIRNDGTDFILKTEGKERIIEAVNKAAASIEKELRDLEYIENAKQQMKNAIPLLQKDFLIELIKGMDCSNEERKRQFIELDIPLNPQVGILLLMCRADMWPLDIGFTEKMKMIYEIQNIVNLQLEKIVRIFPVIFEETSLLWIMQPLDLIISGDNFRADRNVWQRVVSIVQGTVDSMQKAIREMVGIPVSIIVSRYPSAWEMLAATFDSMRLSLSKAAGVSSEALLVVDNGFYENSARQEMDSKNKYELSYQLRKKDLLEKYLYDGQREEFKRTLSEIFTAIENLTDIKDSMAGAAYYSVAAVFLSYLYKERLFDNPVFQSAIDLEKLVNLNSHSAWDGVKLYFAQLAELIFDNKADEYLVSTGRIIEKVNAYIENNIDKAPSLAELAEFSNFNPSYLSRLYKQFMNKSVSEYITEVRVKKAKELLSHSNLKINEIAASIGINTPSYFTCFFRKNTGTTPQEYRKMNE